jgi:hypothetical protein
MLLASQAVKIEGFCKTEPSIGGLKSLTKNDRLCYFFNGGPFFSSPSCLAFLILTP